MNNIQYIANKYFYIKHTSPKKEGQIQHWTGLVYDLLTNGGDLKQYITISIQESINYEDLCQIFNNMLEYGHLFIKEDCKDVVERLFNDFKNHPGYDEKRGSLGVVHIIDEGFIIIPYGSFDYKVWREYTLEDYENKKQEYVVCGMAKNEKDYIRDWVAYQLHIGFDKVYLYDNGNNDIEQLQEFIETNQLEIIDVKDKRGYQNALYHAFYYTMPFKYVAVVDIDEFIWIKETSKYTNIKQFIDEVVGDKIQYGIMLQWKCYRGTHANENTSKPIWELDNEPLDYSMRRNGRCELVNGWLKSIYKANYQLSFNEHFAWQTANDYYNFCLEMVDWKGEKVWKTFCDFNVNEQDKSEVFVKHFLFRNIQNVFYNKYLRGHAGFGSDCDWSIGSDGWNYRLWLHNMNYYTDLVPYIDKEEQLFMRSKGMKINYTFHPDIILINNILRGNTNINAAVNEYSRQIQDWSNTQYVEIDCDKVGDLVQPDYKEEFKLPEELYSFDFNRYATYNSFYCGHYIGEEGWIVDNKYQEQIVLCIGFPLEYMLGEVDKETQQKHIQHLKEFLCYNNIRNMFRQILEHPNYLFVHNQFIQPIGDAYGWKENLEGFLKENNLSLPQYKLMNNTFCTSLSNYKKIKDLQHKFVDKNGACDNWWIIDTIKNNYTTPYHAMLCTMLSPIKDVIPLYFL